MLKIKSDDAVSNLAFNHRKPAIDIFFEKHRRCFFFPLPGCQPLEYRAGGRSPRYSLLYARRRFRVGRAFDSCIITFSASSPSTGDRGYPSTQPPRANGEGPGLRSRSECFFFQHFQFQFIFSLPRPATSGEESKGVSEAKRSALHWAVHDGAV